MTLLRVMFPKFAPTSSMAGARKLQSDIVTFVMEFGLAPAPSPIKNPVNAQIPLQLLTETVSMLNLLGAPLYAIVSSRIREVLFTLQLLTVTREMSPLSPSGQLNAIASSSVVMLQFETAMSLAGPST